MFAVRDIPRNPFILVYHVPIELTGTVVDGYATGTGRTSPPLVAAILGIPGVRGLQFFRYELWVRGTPEAALRALMPAIEAALSRHLGIGEIREFTSDQCYMTIDVRHFDVPRPLVFEAVEIAASHPLARELFAIAGVAEVFFTSGQLRVRKGVAFRWEEMQTSIEAVLRQYRQREWVGSSC